MPVVRVTSDTGTLIGRVQLPQQQHQRLDDDALVFDVETARRDVVIREVEGHQPVDLGAEQILRRRRGRAATAARQSPQQREQAISPLASERHRSLPSGLMFRGQEQCEAARCRREERAGTSAPAGMRSLASRLPTWRRTRYSACSAANRAGVRSPAGAAAVSPLLHGEHTAARVVAALQHPQHPAPGASAGRAATDASEFAAISARDSARAGAVGTQTARAGWRTPTNRGNDCCVIDGIHPGSNHDDIPTQAVGARATGARSSASAPTSSSTCSR